MDRDLLALAICFSLGGLQTRAEDAAVSKELFVKVVWPTLEARCFKCHGEMKQKGELRLDHKDTAFKGGESKKPGIVPGDTAKSQITVRINLPEDHDDVMPPKKPSLTKEEKEAITQWVKTGAVWVTLERPAMAEVEKNPARKVPPPDPDALKALQDAGALADSISEATNLVRVDFMRVSGEVTDQSLLALKQLEPQLSWLNLANTRVTDAGLVHLKGLKHLTRLHLEKTEISDAGLAHLAGLADLEYLNLYGTNVTDESLATIAGFPSLKAVYLWETKVTDQAAEAFRKSNPKLSVDTGWRLPSDMPLPEKPKTLQISKALKAPDLDGTTDEELWKTAAAIEEFLLLGDGKNKPKAKTTGKLSYDEKFFYVAAICEESGRNEPFITGGPVYQDDAIEIWIDANGDGQTFHQLIVNATGKSQGFGPAGMIDLPAQCFAHAEAGKQWTLEVAIPYTSLGIAAPKTGEKWRFNLCRNRPKGDNFDRELITWNPLQTRFKELDLFGTIIFSAADAAKPANSLCPLTGKPVNTAHTFIHKGTTVGLCCPDCLAKFKEEPDKFFDKVKP